MLHMLAETVVAMFYLLVTAGSRSGSNSDASEESSSDFTSSRLPGSLESSTFPSRSLSGRCSGVSEDDSIDPSLASPLGPKKNLVWNRELWLNANLSRHHPAFQVPLTTPSSDATASSSSTVLSSPLPVASSPSWLSSSQMASHKSSSLISSGASIKINSKKRPLELLDLPQPLRHLTKDKAARMAESLRLGFPEESDVLLYRRAYMNASNALQRERDELQANLPIDVLSTCPSLHSPSLPTLSKDEKHPFVHWVYFGKHRIKPDYSAPYPAEYVSANSNLYICRFCLTYTNSAFSHKRHQMKCHFRHPPGNEIIREGNISLFEVDGFREKEFCQNLCLLGKLFLDHKTLYYDVEYFTFYIMTEYHLSYGFEYVGYFSKEKNSPLNYNLSCIVVFPPHRSKGYGQRLIHYSYQISRGKPGTCEKPLSDDGLLAYSKYWTKAVISYITDHFHETFTINDMSRETGMTPNDILTTFEWMGVIDSSDCVRHGRVLVKFNENLDFNFIRARKK